MAAASLAPTMAVTAVAVAAAPVARAATRATTIISARSEPHRAQESLQGGAAVVGGLFISRAGSPGLSHRAPSQKKRPHRREQRQWSRDGGWDLSRSRRHPDRYAAKDSKFHCPNFPHPANLYH